MKKAHVSLIYSKSTYFLSKKRLDKVRQVFYCYSEDLLISFDKIKKKEFNKRAELALEEDKEKYADLDYLFVLDLDYFFADIHKISSIIYDFLGGGCQEIKNPLICAIQKKSRGVQKIQDDYFSSFEKVTLDDLNVDFAKSLVEFYLKKDRRVLWIDFYMDSPEKWKESVVSHNRVFLDIENVFKIEIGRADVPIFRGKEIEELENILMNKDNQGFLNKFDFMLLNVFSSNKTLVKEYKTDGIFSFFGDGTFLGNKSEIIEELKKWTI